MKHFRVAARLFAISTICFLSACASTNFDVEQNPSFAIPVSPETRLGRLSLQWRESHPGKQSFFLPLAHGSDAFGARLRFIDAARESIDLQYFLMKDDIVGAMMSAKLIEAADRGVRVRFLLDDIFTTINDVDLFVLDEHQNIEVRLFNPIARRGFRNLNYLWDFSRANRRMHNKSFTVDGSLTIVGGRNLASEYFSLNDDTEFFDLDVLAMGPVVEEVAANFDSFWNFPKALGIEHLRAKPTPTQKERARDMIANVMSGEGATIYRDAVNSRMPLASDGDDGGFIAEAHLMTEKPEKLTLSVNDDSERLINDLGAYMLNSEREIVIISPYFIPTSRGMDFIQSIRDKGVRFKLVTNSLAATNHVAVHGAYEKYRKGLLAMGVEIFEVRPDAFQLIEQEPDGRRRTTLHTKLLIIDQRFLFIGSLNMDPRSVAINTEMGIMIDSPEFAEALLAEMKDTFDEDVYRLALNDAGKLRWYSLENGALIEHRKEPQTSWWRRFKANFFKILPEGQL
jgi:putative cardiolipin synthase